MHFFPTTTTYLKRLNLFFCYTLFPIFLTSMIVFSFIQDLFKQLVNIKFQKEFIFTHEFGWWIHWTAKSLFTRETMFIGFSVRGNDNLLSGNNFLLSDNVILLSNNDLSLSKWYFAEWQQNFVYWYRNIAHDSAKKPATIETIDSRNIARYFVPNKILLKFAEILRFSIIVHYRFHYFCPIL